MDFKGKSMKKVVVISLFCASLLGAVEHTLEFGGVVNTGETNEYGESIYEKTVSAYSKGIV